MLLLLVYRFALLSRQFVASLVGEWSVHIGPQVSIYLITPMM